VTKPAERPRRDSTRASGMGRFYLVLALIAVFGVGAVGYNVTLGRTDRAPSTTMRSWHWLEASRRGIPTHR
jgi:hypothetical protein